MQITPGKPVRCLRDWQEAGEGNGRQSKEESCKRSPGQMEGERVEEDEADVLTLKQALNYCSFGLQSLYHFVTCEIFAILFIELRKPLLAVSAT